MRNRSIVALVALALGLPVAVGGLVFAGSDARNGKKESTVGQATYTCPMTGEELPCPNCCPMKR